MKIIGWLLCVCLVPAAVTSPSTFAPAPSAPLPAPAERLIFQPQDDGDGFEGTPFAEDDTTTTQAPLLPRDDDLEKSRGSADLDMDLDLDLDLDADTYDGDDYLDFAKRIVVTDSTTTDSTDATDSTTAATTDTTAPGLVVATTKGSVQGFVDTKKGRVRQFLG